MPEGKLRFKVKRGDTEIELEGDSEYVKEKFEYLVNNMEFLSPSSLNKLSPATVVRQTPSDLNGIIEMNPDGKPYLTVPVDMITAKEALSLVLYSMHPSQLSDEELSTLLSSSWKTMKPEAVRARASELRRDGRLVADKGKYNLSGAGIQWIQNEVISKLKRT